MQILDYFLLAEKIGRACEISISQSPGKARRVNIYHTGKRTASASDRESYLKGQGGLSAGNTIGHFRRSASALLRRDLILYSIANFAGDLLFDLASISGQSYKRRQPQTGQTLHGQIL